MDIVSEINAFNYFIYSAQCFKTDSNTDCTVVPKQNRLSSKRESEFKIIIRGNPYATNEHRSLKRSLKTEL